ncbi:MAG: MBL fold metallo-hydrolase [Bdellovibrionota bacterium]
MVVVNQFLIGDYQNFVYLITSGTESLVVDPQADLSPWVDRMNELGSKLVGVLLTHTHWDHVRGLPAVVEKFCSGRDFPPIYLHKLDARRMQSKAEEIRTRFRFVDEGTRIPVGSHAVEVLHTPGHSAGECCYLVRDGAQNHLFTGDTVFVGDVGRTDGETGSTKEMFASLQRLKELPADTILYPGHDYGKTPTTSLARECKESAAFRCRTVEELDALP